jgi:hypothetical protein
MSYGLCICQPSANPISLGKLMLRAADMTLHTRYERHRIDTYAPVRPRFELLV